MACVRKRNSKWIVDYRVGNARKRASFNTKLEAETFFRELKLRSLDSQIGFKQIKPINLKEAINRYWTTFSQQKAAMTCKLEKLYFEKLYDFLDNKSLTHITLMDLENFQVHLRKGVDASTVNRHFNTYRHFFRKCLDWEYLHFNPAEKLGNLKADVKLKKLWSDKQIQQVLNQAAPWASNAFFYLALTGLRPSQLARMLWQDINFDSKVYFVKTYKGTGRARESYLPLTDEMITFLKVKKEEALRLGKAQDKDHVFLNASLQPATSNQLTREMCRLAKKNKLEGLNIKALRHTFITKLAERNCNLEIIRELAGHSNLRTTQQYLHVSVNHLRDAMNGAVTERNVIPFGKVGL